jgi:hypothetical protein
MKVNAPEEVNPLGSTQRFRIALCVVGPNLCFSLALAYEEGGMAYHANIVFGFYFKHE